VTRTLGLVSDRVASAASVRHDEITPLLQGIVRAGGKRLRPLLLLLAARGYNFESTADNLISAGAALELLHVASLVHDDTVDRATSRRGVPTLNTELDTGAVILIGDYLFAQSAKLAAETGSPRVISIFATILSDICDGQLSEMLASNRLDQSRDEYLDRVGGKTASLFAGAAEMGAFIGGAPESDVQELRQFGQDVGIAFQIIDDVLDITSSSTDLGKPTGNDLREGTITLPVIYYLQRSPNGSDRISAVAGVTDGTASAEEVEQVIDDIRSSSAIEESMVDARSYVESACKHAEVVTNPEAREQLDAFAALAIDRAS